MPDWIGERTVGVRPEATLVFGRNAQIAAFGPYELSVNPRTYWRSMSMRASSGARICMSKLLIRSLPNCVDAAVLHTLSGKRRWVGSVKGRTGASRGKRHARGAGRAPC
jgi:hypothetical protein